ncbi:MAG: hypothetical protein LBS92_05800 [Candidatus Methanoplasma sp.]|jgi:hypothetical protein|nr:hypothetical protein [Candidatus Methanoplasma sp.]
MSGCTLAITPRPLELGVVIEDPKVNGGSAFTYSRELDEIYFYPFTGQSVGPIFSEEILAVLPKYAYVFNSIYFEYFQEDKDNNTERYTHAIASLERFAAFVRKTVKEMGEFWYTRQWTDTVPQKAKDMVIREMCIDDLKFAGDDVDSFGWEEGVFYKFVDVRR